MLSSDRHTVSTDPPVLPLPSARRPDDLASVAIASVTGAVLGFVLSLVLAALFAGSMPAVILGGLLVTGGCQTWERRMAEVDLTFTEFLAISRSAMLLTVLGMAVALAHEWLAGMQAAVLVGCGAPIWRARARRGRCD